MHFVGLVLTSTYFNDCLSFINQSCNQCISYFSLSNTTAATAFSGYAVQLFYWFYLYASKLFSSAVHLSFHICQASHFCTFNNALQLIYLFISAFSICTTFSRNVLPYVRSEVHCVVDLMSSL